MGLALTGMIYGFGMDLGSIYDLGPKYGLTAWDINSMFIMLAPSLVLPLAFYHSFGGVGKNLTYFADLYLQCSPEVKGEAHCMTFGLIFAEEPSEF